MPRLTATRGLPASGKTSWTLARLAEAEPGALVRLNRDSLRLLLHSGVYGGDKTERQVTAVQHSGVEHLLRSRVDVIVDDTNLRASNLRRLAELAWTTGADFRVEDFTHVTVDECVARDTARDTNVGEDVIRGMHRKFLLGRTLPLPVPERPETPKGQPYVPGLHLPKAIMIDIDGTALNRVDRDPYDTSRYHEDIPNAPVVAAVRAMVGAGYFPVFCSGRDEEFRSVTEVSIEHHVACGPHDLHMRPQGDKRRDDVVKLDLFDQHIRDRWRIEFVIDDRDRVVAAWRSIGLTVLQCAPGGF